MKILTIISGLILFLGVSTGKSSTITWTNTAGGNWNDSANWSPQQVPGDSDIAVITNSGTYTVTLSTGTTIGGFMLGATNGIGSQTLFLGIANTLTVNGLASVFSSGKIAGGSGGTLAGNWTVLNATISGALNLATNGVLNFVAAVPSSASFEALTLTSYGTVNWSNVNLSASSTSQIYNYGLWDAQMNDQFSGSVTFNNYGTFRKSGGTSNFGSSYFDYNVSFNNYPAGLVDLQSGTTYFSTITDGGAVNVAVNTMFTANPCFLTGSPVFSGQGLIGGSLSGGFAVVNGVLNLTNAALGGTMTLATNSVLNFVTSVPSAANFAGLTLTNYGTVNWSNVNLSASSASQIENYGLWEARGNDTFTASSGTTTFNNHGVFRKSAGFLTYVDYNIYFNNWFDGLVDLQSGTTYFSTITDGGTVNVAVNTMFTANPCFLTGSPVFSGQGLISGSLSGGFAVVNGVLNLTNAALGGTMTLATNSVMNFVTSVPSAANFAGLTLTNYGTVNWSNVNLSASSASQIENYGLWEALGNDLFTATSGTATFNNHGVFRKSADFLTYVDYNIYFNNWPDGTVDIQNGTAYFSQTTDGGTVNTVSNSMFSSAGCFLTGSPVFGGAGKVNGNFYGGFALVNGVLNLTNATLGGTMTLASNAVMNLTNDIFATITFSGLTLTNYGTVNWAGVMLTASSSSQIENYGLWDSRQDDLMTGSSGTTTFNNHSVFRKSGESSFGGPTYFDSYIYFNNYPEGTVDIQNGTAYFSQTTDGGTVNTVSNSMFSSAGCFLTGTPVFTGAGKVNGNFYGGFALVNGVLNLTNATLGGTLTLASNAVMNLTNDMFATVTFSGLTLTNYGTVNWAGVMLTASSSSQIENYGLWDSRQDDLMTGSSGTTTFNNHSVFRKSGKTSLGIPTYFDSYTYFNNYPGGTVDAQIGAVLFGGNYSLAGGTLNFGISSWTNFGSINLGNNALLAGTISANLKNGYVPTNGSVFAVLSYGSATGAFTALNLPHLAGGLIWQTNAEATTFSLSVTSAPPFQLTTSGLTQNGTNFGFSFGAIPGQVYQVQSTTNLAPAYWINFGDPITASNGSVFVSDLIGTNRNRFYRVILQ